MPCGSRQRGRGAVSGGKRNCGHQKSFVVMKDACHFPDEKCLVCLVPSAFRQRAARRASRRACGTPLCSESRVFDLTFSTVAEPGPGLVVFVRGVVRTGGAVAAEKQVVVRRGHRLARRIIVPIEDEACLPKQGQEK